MTTFVPHTLAEQIALITAEAEGKAIYAVDSTGYKVSKSAGVWCFDLWRYEVEQPLMEEWKVVDKNGGVWSRELRSASDAAREAVECDRTMSSAAPFRVVHMREVRATQGPTP